LTPNIPFSPTCSANQSIHDVLTLANLLVDLKENTLEDIGSMFETYYKERAPVGRAIVQMSSRAGDVMNRKVRGIQRDVTKCAKARSWQADIETNTRIFFSVNQGWFNDLVRKVALRHTPRWLAQLANDRMSYDRPQAAFLPFVDVGGTLQPRPQTRSEYTPFSEEQSC